MRITFRYAGKLHWAPGFKGLTGKKYAMQARLFPVHPFAFPSLFRLIKSDGRTCGSNLLSKNRQGLFYNFIHDSRFSKSTFS
jgi:hypothetical protein